MKTNRFFNPSPLYKEFMVLNAIDKYESITQRAMSSFVGASISMINAYIDDYEKKGHVLREYESAKVVHYSLTKQGIERLKLLNVWFLSDAQKIYTLAQENINQFLSDIKQVNRISVLLYGAGEMGLLFHSVIQEKLEAFNIIGFIDDDQNKQQSGFLDLPVFKMSELNDIRFDVIIISSYNHHLGMKDKLLKYGVNPTMIKGFFDEI